MHHISSCMVAKFCLLRCSTLACYLMCKLGQNCMVVRWVAQKHNRWSDWPFFKHWREVVNPFFENSRFTCVWRNFLLTICVTSKCSHIFLWAKPARTCKLWLTPTGCMLASSSKFAWTAASSTRWITSFVFRRCLLLTCGLACQTKYAPSNFPFEDWVSCNSRLCSV